jgi:hypothetical protein
MLMALMIHNATPTKRRLANSVDIKSVLFR